MTFGAISLMNMNSESLRLMSSTVAPLYASGSIIQNSSAADLDALTTPDEQTWLAERTPYLLY